MTVTTIAGILADGALAGPGDLWVFGADTPVTSDPYHQAHAAIDGSTVLWTDCGPDRNSCRIMHKDLDGTAPAEALVPMADGQDDADMDEGVVVWRQLVPGASGGVSYQIYYLEPGSMGPLALSPGAGHQTHPSISAGRVVWEDERAGSKQADIYTLDLATGDESPVCTESSRQIQPDIEGDWVVWVDNRGGSYNYGTATENDIYARNLATGEERRVTADASRVIQSNPDMGRDGLTGDYYAIFEGDGIWLYDFQTRDTVQLAGSGTEPDLDGHVAVWKSSVSGGVMMYDTRTGERQPVSTGSGPTFNPAVSGTRIVWGDERDGDRDIYENRLLENSWALAERYKPLLHFDHDVFDPTRRDFEPRTVELLTDVQNAHLVTGGEQIDSPAPDDLAHHPGADNYLDLPGSPANPLNDYCDSYMALLDASPNGYPLTVYSRIVPHDAGQEETVIQYWLLYYFNDWYNRHEGDWEMVQVTLDRKLQPLAVSYSQHGDAQTKDWNEPGVLRYWEHPRVFVARGSHANYFREGDDLRGANVWGRVDRTGSTTSYFPNLEMDWNSGGWVDFAGLWGEAASWWWPPYTVNEGPRGPAYQGLSWDDPLGWAAASGWEDGLDSAVISVSAGVDLHVHDGTGSHVGIAADGSIETAIPHSEYFRKQSDGSANIVIHGADVADGLTLILEVQESGPVDVRVQVPDRAGGIVNRREYLSIDAVPGSMGTLDLASTGEMLFTLDEDNDGIAENAIDADISLPVQVDFVPPGAVEDLNLTAVGSRGAGIAWSAPGDDGDLGAASAYEVRYATEPLTGDNWFQAREAGSALEPQAAGYREELLVQDLQPGTTYFIGVRARDDAWQLGPLSSPVEFTTTEPDLMWSNAGSYWASLSDYQNNRLTVVYDLSSIGSGTASGLEVRDSSCSPGLVELVTAMPLKLAELAPGESTMVPLTYLVPDGIGSFRTQTYVLCRDDAGGEYWFPGQPPDGSSQGG